MSTAITLAAAADLALVLGLMQRSAVECGRPWDAGQRQIAVAPLLAGGPQGAVWLIGPARAPLGHVVVTFGWSLDRGGSEAWVEDIYIRPSVRNRGIGTEVLHAVAVSLRQAGLKALHARVGREDTGAQRFCQRVGFAPQAGLLVMSDFL